MRVFVFLFLLIGSCFSQQAWTQSYAFGLKVGPSLGIQNWNGFEQDLLIKYHGALFIETAPEDSYSSLFAQIGYHIRGSAFRNRLGVNFNNNQIDRLPPTEFQFRNIALTLGFKRRYDLNTGNGQYYYSLGIRGEYTIDTNLEEYEFFASAFNTPIYPVDDFVNPLNYGAYLGGGLQFPFGELVAGFVEISFNPDFSNQYRQPSLQGIRSPFTGNNTTISERLIRNTTVELTFGMRFLRKVIYVD